MGRPRKPTQILELNGAFKKDPQRLKGRSSEPKPTGPVGEPPESFDDDERAMWLEVLSELPPGVATNADRKALELLVKIATRLRMNGIGGRDGVNGSELGTLRGLFGQFGMTPADRSKISVPKAPEEESVFTRLAKAAGAEEHGPN